MAADSRVAIVTGCGKQDGIGAQIARRLSADGFSVVVTDVEATGVRDRHEQASKAGGGWRGVNDLVAEIKGAGGTASAVTGDISVAADVKRMIAAVDERHGRIDVLVNNAGAPFSMAHGDIEEIDPTEFERVMQINVLGTFLMSQAVAPHMRARRWGRIVSIASVAGRQGSKFNAAYSASKAAVIGLSHNLALDLGGDNITANAILPGFIFTSRTLSAMSKKLGGGEVTDDVIAKSRPTVPIGRDGSPDDVAAVVGFLVREDAGFLTGQSYVVDGGAVRL
jgi:NAD(P)-dependent dehydrogenase (short-subunit alcohol dehydrogenase family)